MAATEVSQSLARTASGLIEKKKNRNKREFCYYCEIYQPFITFINIYLFIFYVIFPFWQVLKVWSIWTKSFLLKKKKNAIQPNITC